MSSDEGDDDRWRIKPERHTQVPNRRQRVPKRKTSADIFNETLTRVLLMKPQRQKQEHSCKTAANLIKLVTDVAYALNAEWKTYVPASKSGVITAPLRTLTDDKYECMVPMVRPMRLDGFSVVQRGIDEMPSHRCLIQVNPKLCKEEAHLIRREWESYVSEDGFLKPNAILTWFNRGLSNAVPVVLTDNHSVDKLACSIGEDGTATIRATVTDYDGGELDISQFSVNIYPVYVLDRLPSSLKVTAPLPCFGNYIQGQKEFRRLVTDDLEQGKHIAFLDPKSELGQGSIRKCLPKEGPTWKLNLSFTEYHVYSLIDKYCRGLNFRHVLVLMNILRHENMEELAMLNNDILVNTLFIVSQKHIDKIRTKEAWVLRVLETLCEGLKNNFLPSFYLPRQNLLQLYNVNTKDKTKAHAALQEMLNGLREDPENLCKYASAKNAGRSGAASAKSRLSYYSKGYDVYDYPEILPQTEDDDDDEETGFYEDESSAVHSGWPIAKGENRQQEHDEVQCQPETKGDRSAQQKQNNEEESAISKPTRVGDRSDIY